MNLIVERMIEIVIAMVVLSMIFIVTSDLLRTCIDSDGGENFFQIGTTVCSTGRFTDYCADDFRLNEYSCDANKAEKQTIYLCSKGCDGGQCATEAIAPG